MTVEQQMHVTPISIASATGWYATYKTKDDSTKIIPLACWALCNMTRGSIQIEGDKGQPVVMGMVTQGVAFDLVFAPAVKGMTFSGYVDDDHLGAVDGTIDDKGAWRGGNDE